MEANENYFAGAPKIQKLRLRFITDASVAYMELQNGGVDIVTSPNWTDVDSVLAGAASGIDCWEESSAYMPVSYTHLNFGNLISDRIDRVQGRHRILENH